MFPSFLLHVGYVMIAGSLLLVTLFLAGRVVAVLQAHHQRLWLLESARPATPAFPARPWEARLTPEGACEDCGRRSYSRRIYGVADHCHACAPRCRSGHCLWCVPICERGHCAACPPACDQCTAAARTP